MNMISDLLRMNMTFLWPKTPFSKATIMVTQHSKTFIKMGENGRERPISFEKKWFLFQIVYADCRVWSMNCSIHLIYLVFLQIIANISQLQIDHYKQAAMMAMMMFRTFQHEVLQFLQNHVDEKICLALFRSRVKKEKRTKWVPYDFCIAL